MRAEPERRRKTSREERGRGSISRNAKRRNPDVWPQLTSGSEGRGRRRGRISRRLRVQEAERCLGDGDGPLVRMRGSGGFTGGEWWEMAAAQAVEEMRTRVVLGEFGVRNVSSDLNSGERKAGQEEEVWFGAGPPCPLVNRSVCSRSIPLTSPGTTRVMMMLGTRTASRRWVALEVPRRLEGPDLTSWFGGWGSLLS